MNAPSWLLRARLAAHSFRAVTVGSAEAKHAVYVIMLHNPGFPQRWGLYVGQTSRDPDWRFDQHKAGYRASGAVRRYGTRLLPSFFEHLNPLQRWESLEVEAALAEAFRAVGVPWVEGGH